jgi:carbon starvation protein
MAVLFAATTMDTGVRLQRFVVQEAGDIMGFSLGKLTATVVVVVVALALTFGSGADGSGGLLIWPLFGTTNQLLAGLTLSILAIMLLRKQRNVLPVVLPMAFLLVMTVYALVVQLGTFYRDQNWLLLVLDIIILVAALWVIVESVGAMNRARGGGDADEDDRLERAGVADTSE